VPTAAYGGYADVVIVSNNKVRTMDVTGKDYLGRELDRRAARPPGIVYWLADKPPNAATAGLALQHLAIQSVYFVIPAVLAGSLSPDPTDATRFLCLSILIAALWQGLMVLVRGPVGSGYPIPGTHTAALVGAYAITGASGGGFGAAGAMLLIAGLVCLALTFLMHRLRLVLPNEVSGVVVMLIGVALVVLGTHRLGLQPGGKLPDVSAVGVMFTSLFVMVAVALSRSRASPFAVLIGALCGVPLALAFGHGVPGSAALLDGRPWLALPQPWAPRFDQISLAPMLAFLVALVAIKATAVGSLVVIQRASDADWSRPDAPPIRRGLLANALAMMAGGLIGSACPGPATAAVGLSIATGTLARRIVSLGAIMLVVVALCPKLVMLFVLVPEPVKAAMLFYVAGFIMAQGCQLVTARLLDTRRTLIVAFGLCAGTAVAVAPAAFVNATPALASPLSVGAMVAFLVNLLTLPLVSRKATLELALDGYASRSVTDWFAGVAGSWALKPQTARAATQSLGELAELLGERGVKTLTLGARQAEDRVEVTLSWAGGALPDPPAFANVEDLMGPDEARQRFSVWLATRQSQGFRQRPVGSGSEAWLAFED
jgi:NCS2 family nucleobase:cation symporter-2